MRILRHALALVLAFGFILAFSPQVHAQFAPRPPDLEIADQPCCPEFQRAPCEVEIYGQRFLDSDCDKVMNQDAEGDPVDNCVYYPNGDCIVDPLDCDVNGDGDPTPAELNAGHQADWDRDGLGDVCDDSDEDTVLDYLDNCKSIYNPDQDPEACTDTDGDGFEDPIDNCPERYNIRQEDTDLDGVGDTCDICRFDFNPNQEDSDDDGIGDACPEDAGTAPSPTAPPAIPSEGVVLPFGPDYERGSGGCHLMAHGPLAMPWLAVGMILAALALSARRREK